MGSKLSKTRGSNHDGQSFHLFSMKQRSIPYYFLDTSEIPSYDTPNMMKVFAMPYLGPPHLFFPGVPVLAFLKDEQFLLFGETDETVDIVRKRELTSHLSKINLQSNESQKLIDVAVGDISVSYDTGHVVFLTYEHSYRHLQLWRLNGKSNLYRVEKFQAEKFKPNGKIKPCCSISPNGKWLLLVGAYLPVKYVVVYTIEKHRLHFKREVLISNVHDEQLVSVEFSPDSKFFAVGSRVLFAQAKVFLLSTETWQVITEIEDAGIFNGLYTTIWGAFNPLSIHCQFISLTSLGSLEKWDTSPLYNNLNQQLDRINNMCISDSSPNLYGNSWPKFSPDGNMFVFTCSNGSIIIIDPNLFEKLWIIAWPESLVDVQEAGLTATNIERILQAKSVCFSKSCEYLAVSYAGCLVSVWLLPRMHFTLKHLCRTKIISMYPPNLLHELPIPDGLKNYLLYQS